MGISRNLIQRLKPAINWLWKHNKQRATNLGVLS